MWIYLLIVVLVIIALLILMNNKFLPKTSLFANEEKTQKNRGDEKEISLIPCAKCGVYTPDDNCLLKQGKYYCKKCLGFDK